MMIYKQNQILGDKNILLEDPLSKVIEILKKLFKVLMNKVLKL